MRKIVIPETKIPGNRFSALERPGRGSYAKKEEEADREKVSVEMERGQSDRESLESFRFLSMCAHFCFLFFFFVLCLFTQFFRFVDRLFLVTLFEIFLIKLKNYYFIFWNLKFVKLWLVNFFFFLKLICCLLKHTWNSTFNKTMSICNTFDYKFHYALTFSNYLTTKNLKLVYLLAMGN